MKGFLSDYDLKHERDKALKKIKDERTQNKTNELKSNSASKIQKWWRKMKIKSQSISLLQTQLDKKLSDLELVDTLATKKGLKEINVPLPLHQMFLSQIHFIFKFYSRKLRNRKKVPRGYEQGILLFLTSVEKLLRWTLRAMNYSNLETFNFYMVASKDSKVAKFNSFSKLKKLVDMSIEIIEWMENHINLYQSKTILASITLLSACFDPTKFSKESESQINPSRVIYDLIRSTFKIDPTKKSEKKELLQLLALLLKKEISLKKEGESSDLMKKIFEVVRALVSCFGLLIKNNTQRTKQDHQLYVQIQSDFVIHFLSIPRFSRFLTSGNQKEIQNFSNDNSKSNLDIFWRNIFQSFLYFNFQDPFCDISTLQREFATLFRNSTPIYYMLGNLIEIFSIYCAHWRPADRWSGVRLIHLCSTFLTSNWLNNLLGKFETDKEYWCLREQFGRLFDSDFLQKIFSNICKEDSNNQNSILCFGRDADLDVIEVFALWIAECDGILEYALKFTQALTFQRNIIRQLYQIFIMKFYDIISKPGIAYHKDFPRTGFAILNLLLLLTYNSLIITPPEDFFQNVIFTKAEIVDFIKIIIRMSMIVNYNLETCENQKLKLFFARISAKFMALIQEFNICLNFLDQKEYRMDAQWEKRLKYESMACKRYALDYLKSLPFTLSFEARLEILRSLIQKEKEMYMSVRKIGIRREALFDDGLKAFTSISKQELKGRLMVVFMDELGQIEEGVDAGGLFKEFLVELSKIIFDPNYGLFKLTEDQSIYPNPDSLEILGAEHITYFYFVGLVVGRAIYDNILIGAEFSQFFLRKALGKTNYLNELQLLDKEMYNNLKFLKTYEGDAKDLSLNFTVMEGNQEIELLDRGTFMNVTNDNKFKYIYLMANHKLDGVIKDQSKAFLAGLYNFIPVEWLKLFNEEEVQIIISGMKKNLDVDDLKRHTAYKGYSSFDSTIRDFWSIFNELEENDKMLFLKFVTSCPRPPLLGFSNLNPPFTIQQVDNPDGEKLPASSTCFNILKLPKYSSKKKMKEKLLLAIKSSSGFNLA